MTFLEGLLWNHELRITNGFGYGSLEHSVDIPFTHVALFSSGVFADFHVYPFLSVQTFNIP